MTRTADSITREQRFTGETLNADGPTRQEMLRVVAAVTAALPESEDHLPVLRALLAPPRAALPPHGKSPSPTLKTARKAWLARCRSWVIEQGREPRVVSEEDQRAYTEATGDVWDLSEWRAK